MTQELQGAATPPNMAKQVWPFCGGCGQHQKSADFRVKTGTVRCDECAARRRRRRRPRPWRAS